MIDSLCDQAKEEDIAVACLYCDFLAQQEQTITNMVGAILKQLVGRGDIPKDVRQAFQEGKREVGGRRLLLADLMRMLKVAIASLPQVFICIDALDECLPKHLPELLGSLRDIVRESPWTKIFLTGRFHVREAIQRYFTKAVVIPISPNTDDIRNYLEMRLDQDEEPEAMDSDLRVDIVKIIVDKMSDMYVESVWCFYSINDVYLLAMVLRFLLVSLNIEAILGEVTNGQRRRKLEEMARGNGLSDAYTTTVTRLKGQKGNKSVLGLKVLMWVLHSERPLRAEELCHALGVDIGSVDLDPKNFPALRTLLASCLGLVAVEASSSTVRLVHFTLQEHLLSNPTLFDSPHSIIAEVCLTYLNFRSVWDLPATLDSAPSTMPLLEYASCFWWKHIKTGMGENVKILALRLLYRFDQHISAQLLLLRYNKERRSGPYFNSGEGPTGFTGLHVVSFLGIVEIVAGVLEMKEWNVNATDCMGSTALTWAAGKGYEEVVKILLAREDIDPDQADTKYGQTPLSWAAENGHERVVKMLLERKDVNPGHPDTLYGRTPLGWAAEYGQAGVVKILLEREDVNPDQADTRSGQTPLSWAAKNGHEGIVRILLSREDVNPGRADTLYGRTPLSWAAENGHMGVVKMLLEREGVNPDQADTFYGRTPLGWAAEYRQAGVVNMLLERKNVNPSQKVNAYGQTPLVWAAQNGYEEVVKTLLERGDVNPNQVDTSYYQTPLSWAAENGHQGVAKMLLERKDINLDLADIQWGRTPLAWATVNGHGGIVEMLLERQEKNSPHRHTR